MFAEDAARSIPDPELAAMFTPCLVNTLASAVTMWVDDTGRPDTFVITGDISAMWLRDSAAQVWPYCLLLSQVPELRPVVRGVIHRQSMQILLDPYANAFSPGHSPWHADRTEMRPGVHERKWELDSLCYPMRLSRRYWAETGDTEPFDAGWRLAMTAVLDTLEEQQSGSDHYRFQRLTRTPVDTLAADGAGPPGRPVGLVRSAFRPSDDACLLPYPIPSNHFAAVTLRELAELATALQEPGLAHRAGDLAGSIGAALAAHGSAKHPDRGRVWAYEVDGFGNALFMDDANVPSLLSLPYLGACSADDPLYLATRGLVLSADNPYFYEGSSARGVGGPHVGPDMVWPMALTVQALTASDQSETDECLATLAATHAGTHLIHEAFHVVDPSVYTRGWFGWGNSLFAELLMRRFGVLPPHPQPQT